MNPTRMVFLLVVIAVSLLIGSGLDSWFRQFTATIDNVDKAMSAVEHVITACALVAAGWYFLDQAAQGYHINNLKLALKCERQLCLPETVWSPRMDFLAVQVTLSKGDKGSLTIHDALVRVTSTLSNSRHVERFPGVHRSEMAIVNDRYRIPALDTPDKEFAKLNLPPNEETHFATSVRVLAHEPCFVEVAIVGQLYGTEYTGQWKASVVVLPVLNKADGENPKLPTSSRC